jgi:hypothetical protein
MYRLLKFCYESDVEEVLEKAGRYFESTSNPSPARFHSEQYS